MIMNPINLLRHEFIGREVEIVGSSNKSLLGIRGKIVDERKNTFDVETVNGVKRVLKSVVKLKVRFGTKTAEIDGKLLVARPEDRLKKKFRV